MKNSRGVFDTHEVFSLLPSIQLFKDASKMKRIHTCRWRNSRDFVK
jgi:hypothetical protein